MVLLIAVTFLFNLIHSYNTSGSCEGEVESLLCKLRSLLNKNQDNQNVDQRYQQIERQLEQIRENILNLNQTKVNEKTLLEREESYIKKLKIYQNKRESKVKQIIDDLAASIDGAVKTLLIKIENVSSVPYGNFHENSMENP